MSSRQRVAELLCSAILASYLLEEELGHLGRLGCTICLLGSLIIVLHAPADKDIQTVDEMLRYAIQPGALSSPLFHVALYSAMVAHRLLDVLLLRARIHAYHDLRCRTHIWSLKTACIYLHMLACRLCLYHGGQGLRHCREAHPRRKQPVRICQHVWFRTGGCSLHNGSNELLQQSSRYFLYQRVRMPLCPLHLAVSHTELSRVNPLYYVCFSTATIIASLILFQGINTDNPVNTLSLLVGFITIFIGMHLLEVSRKPALTGHHALENGLLNPRLSLQGRPSIDGWAAASAPGLNFGHARRNSRTPSSHVPLFDAFEDAPNDTSHALGLQSLREEDGEDDELEAATERTRLRAEERRSRSHPGSPTGTPGESRRS
jgi:magnesium transporter